MFTTNVTGLIAMTQAILKLYKSRPTPSGDIINIGSIAGREPYQGGSIYCATKAAVRSFTDALRRELIATRIRVIEIDPGQVETEFSVVRFGGDTEKAKKVYEGVDPLTPEDIAEVVVFTAGRRENVVVADTLIFPNHQVRSLLFFFSLLLMCCTLCVYMEAVHEGRWLTHLLQAAATVMHRRPAGQ
jgi:3-hydroxy acid dehydrogenase/malonic semialdehyde reductase